VSRRRLSVALHSLRTRLLVYLGAAITLVAVVQASVAYRTALAEADAIFDYHMQETALSLRGGLPFEPDAEIPETLEHGDENFDFVVQIWSADGQQLYRSARRADLPDRAVLGFSTVLARGSTYRVFSVQTPRQVIQVAQDMEVRREMARTLALRTVAPMAWLVPLLLAAAWWVVGSTLAPLQRLRAQLAERRADDLAPVGEVSGSEEPLPDEIRPVVHELNGLFGRLQHAFDAQKRFVADAAHELRSPLTALKLQVQGLARASDDEARQRAVQRLDAGIERASHLVDQLLLLARQQDGAGPAWRPVVLMDILHLSLADVAPAAQHQGIDLGLIQVCADVHGDGDTGAHLAPTPAADTSVDGDAEALRVMLRNLLDNAVRYTPSGGRVDVALKREGATLRLRIEDSGPGIADAERERVFDRFYRVPGSTATGNGLGLAIVKAIAEGHGGTLALGRSERLGGLRVDLCLPATTGLSPV